jgi:hypothetical protein
MEAEMAAAQLKAEKEARNAATEEEKAKKVAELEEMRKL